MKMKIYFILLNYFSGFMYLVLSSDVSTSEENAKKLITNNKYVFKLKPVDKKMDIPNTSEINLNQKQARSLTTFTDRQTQPEDKNGVISVDKQRQHNPSLEHNKARYTSHTDWRIFPDDIQAQSQNKLTRRRLPSRKSCILSTNGNRQRCLRKIKKRKKKILLKDTNENMHSNHSIETNNNGLSINSLDYSKHISINPNRNLSSANANRIQANSADSVNGTPRGPCTCYWKPDNCGCDCIGSLLYDDFQELSKGFFPCRNFTFTMTEGQQYALPPNFFSNNKRVEVFRLIISNSTFEYVCDPTPMTSPFKGILFSESAFIRLQNVSVRRGWNWKPFAELQSSSGGKVDIVFQDCKLKRLTSDFSNLAKGQVDTIDINNSNLEMVGSSAFGTFINMRNFRVPNNKIQDLRRTDFPEVLPELAEIDLRNNQLQKLEDDLFTNMPNLKEISLSGNPLIVLSEKTFHHVIGQAHLVGLSDIPLYCDCRLKWLKDSKLSDNAVIKQNMNGAICKRPSYLRGIPLEYLSKEHLICL